MTVVTTIDVRDMPNAAHRAGLDRMGVDGLPGAPRA